jgi:hypothetical protein
MSNIALVSPATGTATFSITTPSGTSTDRTLTLPDTSGTLLDSTGSTTMTNLTVTNGASIQGLTVGRGAGAVSTNTAVGYQAGFANTTGTRNTAVGNISFLTSTTGNDNTALGNSALELATTASDNTAVGSFALGSTTNGVSNTAVGRSALGVNTTASNNTAVGHLALTANTTGAQNTAVGRLAGQDNTTGTDNTFLGHGSGQDITTGSKNTIIGRFNGNQGGLDIRTSSNNIVLSDGDGNPRMNVSSGGQVEFRGISLGLGGTTPSIFRNDSTSASGFHFTVPGALPTNGTGALNDNVMPLGGGSNRMSVIFAGTGTISTSDANEKQDIEALSNAELRVAVAIKGLVKKFRWKDAVATKGEDARIHVGVIAQEVQAAFEAENLDAKKYALFCSDTWHELNGSSMDADGNRYTAETEGAIERTRLGVRYDQLLAFVIAAL